MNENLSKIYEAYIACLNARELERLGEYISEEVIYNGSIIGLSGYKEMIAGNYNDIPDLHFVVDILLSDSSTLASRLSFNCRPINSFLGLKVEGQKILFHEHVFYQFAEGKITQVWSIIDKTEIEKQIISNNEL